MTLTVQRDESARDAATASIGPPICRCPAIVRPNPACAASDQPSFGLSAFQTGSEDIPVPGINMELRRNCNQALWSALSFAGFPFAGYELNHGLRVALETPDAEPRWLAGEDLDR